MQTSVGTAPLINKVEVDLVRAIGTGTLAASILNLVVGAGIFALPALVVAEIGTTAPFAYLLCSILVGLVFLCFAEAGSRVAGSGGAYACVEAAFGPLAGFLVSTLLWFGVGVLSCAAISNVIADTVASAWPWTGHASARFLLLFLLFGGFAAINAVGCAHRRSLSLKEFPRSLAGPISRYMRRSGRRIHYAITPYQVAQ